MSYFKHENGLEDPIVQISGFGVKNTMYIVGLTASGKVVITTGDREWADISPRNRKARPTMSRVEVTDEFLNKMGSTGHASPLQVFALVQAVKRLREELEHQFKESARKLYAQAAERTAWGNEQVARAEKAEAELTAARAKVGEWETWYENLLKDFDGVTDNAKDPSRLHCWDWLEGNRPTPESEADNE
jgi:hypothetical protein